MYKIHRKAFTLMINIEDGIRFNKLIKRVDIDYSYAIKLINILKKYRLIQYKTCKMKKNIYLTTKGKTLQREMISLSMKHFQIFPINEMVF